jgi:two-component system CheB/CheR fusion protein
MKNEKTSIKMSKKRDKNHNSEDLYIIGLGTSAGGLEALEHFFKQMPIAPNVAFLVVQHLSPDYKSHMVELLTKYTPIPVQQAEDGVIVKGGNIYLLPPKKNMTIFKNRLYLVDYDRSHGLNLPIDLLFNSLAKNSTNNAIACVLSGTGSDGTRGIRAIKEHGGMVLAQDDTARFDGMPRSAINTQLVDYVAPPEKMPEIILRYIAHPQPIQEARLHEGDDEDLIGKILAILHDQQNVDFSGYKPNTLIRRIERRMSLFEMKDLHDYITYLQKSSNERRILVKEFLIGVTRFFRDTEAFEILQLNIIPKILNGRERRDQVRIWVPACSTGEEAYSLAILFQDYMERTGQFADVKIFATDIDRDALTTAGQGTFPESVLADIPSGLLNRYFIKQGDHYEVVRQIRSMVVFAYQNIISDPPFSRIDLVSCRNVLIYLNTEIQDRILATFQFALKQGGYLFLGSSESLGDRSADFGIENARWKIFQYRGTYQPSMLQTMTTHPKAIKPIPSFRDADYTRPVQDWRNSDPVLRSLVEQVLPACAVVDENLSLLHAFGEVDVYLNPPRGYQVNLNIMKMVPEDVATPLSTAIHRTLREEIDVTYHGIQIERGEQKRTFSMTTRLFWQKGSSQKLVLVIFRDIQEEKDNQVNNETDSSITRYELSKGVNQRIFNLEQELQYTRENLQATIEELETSNEELQATNEELMAANEELQSTNEELESVNEELLTVNNEHQIKIKELSALNDDVNNLLKSTDIGTVFLDVDLKVRKFTPSAQKSINLLDQDIGRPISHFAHHFVAFDLNQHITNVMETLVPVEHEVRHKNGTWLLIRIAPYRTHHNQITGIVMTMVDISDLKQATQRARESDAVASTVFDALSAHIAIINSDGVIVEVNEAWRQFARDNGMPESYDDLGTNYLEVCKNSYGRESEGAVTCYEGLSRVIKGELPSFDLEYPCHAPDEERWYLLRAVPLGTGDGRVIVSHINITSQKQVERALKHETARLNIITDEEKLCVFELDRDLRYIWIHNQGVPYVPETALMTTDETLLPYEQAHLIHTMQQDCLMNEMPIEEHIQLTYDGATYQCKLKMRPLRHDGGNKTTGVLGVYRDFVKS